MRRQTPDSHTQHVPVDRRKFLVQLGLTAGALFLPGITGARAQHQSTIRKLIWIDPDGGEPQIDTWDPKPNAAEGIRGSFSTIETALPGIRISEVYPKMAEKLDSTLLIRSRVTQQASFHLGAMQEMLGRTQTPDRRPGTHLLSEHAHGTGNAPPLYAETPEVIHGFDYRKEAFGVSNIMMELPWNPGNMQYDLSAFQTVLSREELDRRFALLQAVDHFRSVTADRYMQQRDQARSLSGRLQGGIHFSQEDIERYGGRNPLSLGMLTIREALRRNLSTAAIFRAGDWDFHSDIATLLPLQAQKMDAALSSLIEDIDEGILGDTLLVYAGEFGRTPRMWGSGRDHFPISSVILKGDALQEGLVFGETTANGSDIRSGRITTPDFHSIIREALSPRANAAVRRDFPSLFRSGNGPRVASGSD